MEKKILNRDLFDTQQTNWRSSFKNLLHVAAILFMVFYIGSAIITFHYKENKPTWEPTNSSPSLQTSQADSYKNKPTSEPTNSLQILQTSQADSYKNKPTLVPTNSSQSLQISHADPCKSGCRPSGSEPLPKGIVMKTSDLELRRLFGSVVSQYKKRKAKPTKSLLVIPVGIKQKDVVNQIVKKFLSSDFTVMLCHYDGIVDQWMDLQWSDTALHVSARNQTKWWFAKRFLHPDIVEEYDYIFLWDEDLGVENFNPGRYLSIVKREGLEISQPGLDPTKSQVHHQITVRSKTGDVHRRSSNYKFKGGGGCNENSNGPPCTGFVEMMAPVFSRAAWRCAWHMIQNDLVHAWGLDYMLGYCAQGDRTQKVGVVDSEYIVHKGIPSLGGPSKVKVLYKGRYRPGVSNDRVGVRTRSQAEQAEFEHRWQRAAAEDECWDDPYPQPEKESSIKLNFTSI